jgi:hypothetical protein
MMFPLPFNIGDQGDKKNRINLEHRAFNSSRRFLASASDLKVEDNRTWENNPTIKTGYPNVMFLHV